jgi:hypothetical protein
MMNFFLWYLWLFLIAMLWTYFLIASKNIGSVHIPKTTNALIYDALNLNIVIGPIWNSPFSIYFHYAVLISTPYSFSTVTLHKRYKSSWQFTLYSSIMAFLIFSWVWLYKMAFFSYLIRLSKIINTQSNHFC